MEVDGPLQGPGTKILCLNMTIVVICTDLILYLSSIFVCIYSIKAIKFYASAYFYYLLSHSHTCLHELTEYLYLCNHLLHHNLHISLINACSA